MTVGKAAARRAGHREAGTSAVERELARLVPVDVPTGVRGRVLARSGEARRAAALAPWMRVAAAACSLLIGAALGFDAIASRHGEARLAALLDGPKAVDPRAETTPELVEAGLGTRIEAERWARVHELAAAAARKPVPGANLAALERLKGRWKYDTPEDPD